MTGKSGGGDEVSRSPSWSAAVRVADEHSMSARPIIILIHWYFLVMR
jgi:hypothetical protein